MLRSSSLRNCDASGSSLILSRSQPFSLISASRSFLSMKPSVGFTCLRLSTRNAFLLVFFAVTRVFSIVCQSSFTGGLGLKICGWLGYVAKFDEFFRFEDFCEELFVISFSLGFQLPIIIFFKFITFKTSNLSSSDEIIEYTKGK